MLCLPFKIRNHLISNIKDGTLDLEKLANLPSSEERRVMLEQFVGTQASEPMTTLLEKKLIMKNQQDALISFVKDATGMRETVKKDLYSRIERLGEVLTPADEEKFYQNLVSEKLGTKTTFEQAKVISDLAKRFQTAKANLNSGIEYGATEWELNDFMNKLKLENEKRTFSDRIEEFKTDFPKAVGETIKESAGAAKSAKAAGDDSALFRQGWRTLSTHPSIWAKNALKSFDDLSKGLKGFDVVKATDIEILSRKNSRNGLYKRLKVDTANSAEEAFPESWLEKGLKKIPLLGKPLARFYNTSEGAYKAFLHRTRADLADYHINTINELTDKYKPDLSVPSQAESLGTYINSMTGRGSLGSHERSGETLNVLFFSPKNVKAAIDFYTMPLGVDLMGGKVSNYVRKEAQKDLMKVIAVSVGILTTAELLHPGSVETDPRSADFGKISIGNTRFDVTGGLASVFILASRIFTWSSKSSTTGKVTKLNAKNKDGTAKFGSQKVFDDLVFDFFANKLAPLPSVGRQLMNDQTFEGKKPTLGGVTTDLTVPLIGDSTFSAYKDNKSYKEALALATFLAEFGGISTNTYGQPKKKLK